MEENEGIIVRFIQLRKSRNISQIEFGNLLGISGSAIAQMERGKTIINEKHIKLISGVLGINEEWLRSGAGDMIKGGGVPEEEVMLKMFRALSPEGRKMILDYANVILNNERKIAEAGRVEKGESSQKAG